MRLLSRKTVELMTADHLLEVDEDADFGFGLGLSVARGPGESGELTSAGTWGWNGFYTTSFWIDPREELVGLILTQTYPYDSGRVLERLRAVAYQAIADSRRQMRIDSAIEESCSWQIGTSFRCRPLIFTLARRGRRNAENQIVPASPARPVRRSLASLFGVDIDGYHIDEHALRNRFARARAATDY